MKKVILGGVAAIVVAVLATVNVNLNSQNDNLSDLVLANVEALAQNEGGGGTSVGVCYMRAGHTGIYGSRRFCNSQTNATTIYPCGTESMDFYKSDNTDRCTN
jgi:hypothetical protein